MLLAGLGVAPRWVERAYLVGPSIYYGPEPEVCGPHSVAVPLGDAPDFFASNARYPSDRARWCHWDGRHWPVLFGTDGADDLVASAFFWLSGWQEHTCRQRDVHGRFPYGASLQAALGTASMPVVDAYREMLAERLAATGFVPVRPRWAGRSWAFCPTHDIDYLRKWRPGILYREGVEYFLLNRAQSPLAERLRRLTASARQAVSGRDVFRSAMVRMADEVRRRAGRATYFFKAGAHGPRDVAYGLHGTFLQRFFEELHHDGFEIGLHPSYHAHDHASRMRSERSRLSAAAGVPVESVRQHYLRYDPAITPLLHAASGFVLDSSLGFAEHEAFRHGTCHPFLAYDVAANAAGQVWEMPLCLMDGALFNRRHLGAEEARDVTETLLATCRRFGGVCTMLWHNTLWDEIDFPGWGGHFVDTLDAAAREGACLTSLRLALDAYR